MNQTGVRSIGRIRQASMNRELVARSMVVSRSEREARILASSTLGHCRICPRNAALRTISLGSIARTRTSRHREHGGLELEEDERSCSTRGRVK